MATLNQIWTSVWSESATAVDTQKLTRFFAGLIRSDRMRAVQKSACSIDDPFQFLGMSMRISSHRSSSVVLARVHYNTLGARSSSSHNYCDHKQGVGRAKRAPLLVIIIIVGTQSHVQIHASTAPEVPRQINVEVGIHKDGD